MKTVELTQGTVEYVDVGAGPVLLFVHGVLVDHRIWSGAIERLRDRFRCIAPNLPVGSHRLAMRPDADLSMPGQARLVLDLLDALQLEDVTVVANDTGGAVSQLVVAEDPARVRRLVLTNCDAFEVFPPEGFGHLLWAPRVPGFAALLLRTGWRLPSLLRLRTAYGGLTRRPLELTLLRSWIEPAATNPAVRRDLLKLLDGAGPQVTLEVAERLHRFRGQSLLVWSRDDPYFPLSLAQRLAAKLRDARLEVIDGAGLLVPVDQPDRVAAAIERFHASSPAAARTD